MKHILVTGGSGFIGSHLCEVLLNKGYAVTAFDNLVTGREANLDIAKKNPNFHFHKADVCDPIQESAMPLLKKHGLHGIFHFACPASPVDFDRIPFVILNVDSIGTMNTVALAKKFSARYLVASTSEIYGDPLVHPQTEDYWGNVNTIGPRACYDEAKRFSEAYVSTATRLDGLNGAMVRIFNTYGPRMRPDDGRVVPELCMQMLRGQPMTLHGDGKQTRSFCFVTDLVDGIVRLFESDLKVPVNIGNPIEYPMIRFAEILEGLSAKKVGTRHLPARPDDPRRRCPDITRAKTLLGWAPKVELEQGLKLTLEYFKNYL